jgi:hypothetical protein
MISCHLESNIKQYFFHYKHGLIVTLVPQYKLLPPYGAGFAALWPSTNKQSAIQNPGSKFFLGVCVCVSKSLS